MRTLLFAFSLALVACSSSMGKQGPAGKDGAEGPAGPTGPTGAAGASVEITPIAAGDANCPSGGVKLTVGTTSTIVCNGTAGGATGPTGPQGPIGATGPAGMDGAQGPVGPIGAPGTPGTPGAAGMQGPAGPTGPAGASATLAPVANGNANCPYGGTQITIGATVTYACNGGPGGGGSVTYNGGVPPVAFAGYTPQTYAGNLNGRSGAHALCDAAFTGSHFCTNWEVDQVHAPPVTGSAWVDNGDSSATTRYFRLPYSTSDYDTCAGWTTSSANAKPDNVNLATGPTFTALGGFKSSFVATGDGGCEVQRQLACCTGGTAVRFRGFTPSSTGGNLNGRSGANATCNASFSGSHFCADWEVDQAAVHAPIPASGAWVDAGDSSTTTRYQRLPYSTSDYDTCAGWTTSTANAKPDNVNLATGNVLTSQGGLKSSFVATNDGGCEVARPLACCDGYPPQ